MVIKQRSIDIGTMGAGLGGSTEHVSDPRPKMDKVSNLPWETATATARVFPIGIGFRECPGWEGERPVRYWEGEC